MNANLFTTKDYENETAFRPKKTNPNKPNFKLRAYPNNRLVMRPSEKSEAKAAGKKCSPEVVFLHVENVFGRQCRHRASLGDRAGYLDRLLDRKMVQKC